VSAESTNVFVEDFSSSERTAANWSPYGSAFSVSDGTGKLLPGDSVVSVWPNHRGTMHDKGTEPIFFRDLNYTVDVLLTSTKRTMLGFGLDSEGRRIWVGYDVSSVVCVWNNDPESNPREAKGLSVVDNYQPYDGQWHTWSIQVIGSQFDFWIDSHHILTGLLDGYLPGPIGMRSWDGGGSQFDNISAVSLDNYKAPPSTPTPNPTDNTASTTPTETAQETQTPTANPSLNAAPSSTKPLAGTADSAESLPLFDYRVGIMVILGFVYLYLVTRAFNINRQKKVGPNFHRASVFRVILMLIVGFFVGLYVFMAIGSVLAPDASYTPNHLCDICNQQATGTINYISGEHAGQVHNEFCAFHAVFYTVNHFDVAVNAIDLQIVVYSFFISCLFLGWSLIFGVNYALTRNSVYTYTSAKSQQQYSNSGNTDNSANYRSRSETEYGWTQNGGADPYDVLGVARGASEEQVKTAWREACKKWHPDMFTTEDERVKELAKERFTQIQNAYEAIRKERGWT
jgi:hypothetical protein